MIDINKHKIKMRPRGERVRQLKNLQKYCLKNRYDEARISSLFEVYCQVYWRCQKIPLKRILKRYSYA